MPRFCLALLRFCLCMWVGVSMFFVVSVLPVLDALVKDRPPLSRFSHPTFFLPPYFAFGLSLLGPALICACASLGNPKIGVLRRWVIVALVGVMCAIVGSEYALVYPALVKIFSPETTAVTASSVVSVYLLTTASKKLVLALSLIAALVAIWPELSNDRPADLE
ncbi:MAG: hypothetical protein JSS02_19430 [Planctomycetes bacterium]|nr:hypothetical protein [Planctomycetota bacterium]